MNDSPLHPAGGPPESTASRWEDLVDIFYAPRAVFDRRRDGRFVAPLVVLILGAMLLVFAHQQALAPVYDAQFDEVVIELEDAGMDAAGARRILPLVAAAGTIVMLPIGVLILGLGIWLLATMFGASGTGFAVSMVVATFSQFPRLAQYVIEILQGIVLDVRGLDSLLDLSIGPARFLDPDSASRTALAVAARLDLFTLWATVLIAIGMAVTLRLKTGAAVASAVILWAIATGIGLLSAGFGA